MTAGDKAVYACSSTTEGMGRGGVAVGRSRLRDTKTASTIFMTTKHKSEYGKFASLFRL